MLFFFIDTASTEIYPLSLHDALPICGLGLVSEATRPSTGTNARLETVTACEPTPDWPVESVTVAVSVWVPLDRKSTRLNSSHGYISYAVFCLKKKNSLTF